MDHVAHRRNRLQLDNQKGLCWIRFVSYCASTLLCACAVGPLVLHETGRTVGRHNNEVEVGAGSSGNAVKWNFGATDNLDVGIQYETLSYGARIKYALINRRESGFSLAAAGGGGKSLSGHYYNGDIVASYLNGQWEPYSGFRYVYAKTDQDEFNDQDTWHIRLQRRRRHLPLWATLPGFPLLVESALAVIVRAFVLVFLVRFLAPG